MFRQPIGPPRPPAALVTSCSLQPLLRTFRLLAVGPISVLVGRGRVDDARIVPRSPEHEVGAKLAGSAIDRLPRGDVIVLERDNQHWRGDRSQVDRSAADL